MQVRAVAGGQSAIPQGVGRGASKKAVLDPQLVDVRGAQIHDGHGDGRRRVAARTIGGQDPAECGIHRGLCGQGHGKEAPAVGGGDEFTGRGVEGQVRDDDVGQSLGHPFPRGSRVVHTGIDTDIRAGKQGA